MAKSTYVVTSDFKTPYIISTGNPRNPTKIEFKRFKRGNLIAGELKHTNNKPAFVLYNGVAVIPLSVIKKVVTKEIISSAEGNTASPGSETTKNITVQKNKKVSYIDASVIGGLLGAGAVFLAEKQGWIKVPAKINLAYGAVAGILAGSYFIFRSNNKPKIKTR